MGGNAEQVTRHRQRRRQLLIQVLGGKCALCGYSRCAASLDFHHINPDDKNYHFSSGNCHELEKDLEEAKNVFLYVLTAIERYIILICMIIIIYGIINFMIMI